MDGVRLATLFSYMPNKLQYCGPGDVSAVFCDYLKTNANKNKVKSLLTRFEALYPYLEVISKKNNKDLFDYEVVEAYWLGNKLAELDKKAAVNLIEMLTKRGLVESLAKELIKKIEDLDAETIPLTHLFNVIFVGVGAVTQSVPTIIENMEKCRISWGKICEIQDSSLIVEHNKLKKQGNKYFIAENIEKKKVDYDNNFFDDLKIGDEVAIHWDLAVKKLDSRELADLKNYTQKVIGFVSML